MRFLLHLSGKEEGFWWIIPEIIAPGGKELSGIRVWGLTEVRTIAGIDDLFEQSTLFCGMIRHTFYKKNHQL